MKSLTMLILLYIFNINNTVKNIINNNEMNASYYGKKFHGKKTASGEIFNMNAMTAAHKTLKFGTKIKITSVDTKKSVIVKINDRGPFIKGRDIDLSEASFFKIAPKKYGGSIKVKYKIIK